VVVFMWVAAAALGTPAVYVEAFAAGQPPVTHFFRPECAFGGSR
jgi:hypothetical protein